MRQRAALYGCSVGGRVHWLVLELRDRDGVAGFGECSDAGPVERVVDALRAWSAGAPPASDFTGRTVRGGIAQALADQAARRAGMPLWAWYGGRGAGPVPVYANVNRVPGGRSPREVAAAAEAAVTAGFDTVKLAPFDVPGDRPLSRLGLDRVQAVRAALGPSPTVLVDCHERLPLAELTLLLDGFAAAGVGWLEDGVGVERPQELALLRARTELPLAGGEFAWDPAQIERAGGLLDVVLPDVKHAGGPEAVRALARAARADGAQVSLHNPGGPVGTLHSAQLSLALGGGLLETAVGEAPWRPDLVHGAERIANGLLHLPDGPGLGADFDVRHPRVTRLWQGEGPAEDATAGREQEPAEDTATEREREEAQAR